MIQRIIAFLVLLLLSTGAASAKTVTDASGREIKVPDTINHVICSGPGSLRLLTYMQAQDLAVGVDDIEKRRENFSGRPYALANPQFGRLPLFGEFRGHDNPELILTLDPAPQVIFKTYPTMGFDGVELQEKTGIPVIILNYGNLGNYRAQFYSALRIMGEVLGKSQRAEELIGFFDATLKDLQKRTADIEAEKKPGAFLGGVAYKGPHGFQSTEPAYPPFVMVNVRNLAAAEQKKGKELQNSIISKETIISWDPDILFLDLATLQMGDKAGGLFELRTDPAYKTLTAVQKGQVYGVLPYNWYTKNYGSILANAYFIGKLVYPEKFTDINLSEKADEIYSFLVGKPVFAQMNTSFGSMAFTKINLSE